MYDFMKEKMDLANFPTRIEKISFGDGYGVEIFVKREDLDEFVGSGNKARKLEYLLYDAKKDGADVVLTAGGIQSNHCRATAYFAKKIGLDAELFLFGESEFQGNLLLDGLLGAEINRITEEEYEDVMALMEKKTADLAGAGRKAYLIPPGGSSEVGLLGYASAVEEIMEWERQNADFDYVVTATGTVGTALGLEIGRRLFDRKFKTLAVNVTKRSPGAFAERVGKLVERFEERYGVGLGDLSVDVIDGYAGAAYAVPSDEDMRCIVDVARKDQIVLDPVYTSKAFNGMMDMIGKGEIPKGSRVLFLHTGGTFGLFSFTDALKRFV